MAALMRFSFTLHIDSFRMSAARWYTPGRAEIVQPPNSDGWLTMRFQVESIDPPELRDSIVEFARQLLHQGQREAHSPSFTFDAIPLRAPRTCWCPTDIRHSRQG